MAYLQAQPFVRPGPMGVSGFCFGGRTALLLAARERAIGAVVSFYGNLSRPPGSTRLTPLEALERLAVPVQGHYAKEDPLIPLSDVTQLETALRRRHVPVEMHTYEASHGFFAYTRPVYNARAAEAAGRRMITWFRRYLG
jgi:carboxymethylenebutenolidase